MALERPIPESHDEATDFREPVVRKMPARKVTSQTSEGLRRALFDQLDMLRNGQVTPTMANATARLAEAIVHTVELEIDVETTAQRLGKRGDKLINILPPTVPLGNRQEAATIEISGHSEPPDDDQPKPMSDWVA